MTGLQINALLLVGAMMLLFFFGTVIIYEKITAEKQLVVKRVGLVINKKADENKKKNKGKNKTTGSGFIIKQSVFQKVSDVMFDELMAADIMMKPDEFLLLWIVIAFVPALLAIVFSGNPLLPVVLSVIGVIAPIAVIKNKQGKRVKEFENQLSDALLICCNCLRAGLTFTQAMENIAEEMDAPIGPEFKRVVNEMTFGSSMDDALNNMLDRVESADLKLTVAAVSIQRQTGGNLSEILESISNTIRERIKIKKEIKTITSQGRFSGIIIGALPIVIAMILMVMNPSYIMTFFTTETGNIMLLVSAVLEIIGFVTINKMVDIKY